VTETGTGQGQTISPLLANVYLHYVLDEWFENEVKPRLKGAAHEIRFAEDAVLCFQYREDAEKVMGVLPKRFAKSSSSYSPSSTACADVREAEEIERGWFLPLPLQYAITDGQAATEGLYYAKLPKLLQDQDQELLAQMTVNGQPLK
jgi:hypothetical protein